MSQRADLVFAKVDGHEDLVRDMSTGAVHNINRTALQHARLKKKSAQRERDKVTTLERQVEELRRVVEELKVSMVAAASAYQHDVRSLCVGGTN